jgi:hypothetical protein
VLGSTFPALACRNSRRLQTQNIAAYSLLLRSVMQQISNTDLHLIHKMVIKYIKVIKIIKILNMYALSQCYMFRPYKAIFRQHF